MKLCWLFPDDRGGGVASVALSCARKAQAAGHEATLLVVLPLTGWLQHSANGAFRLDSLGLPPPAADTAAALLGWLEEHPQDVLVLNGCEQADGAIPYLRSSVRCVYGVHDTAARYWRTAVAQERQLDAIVAVSQAVAGRFERQLRDSTKLRVIHNGSACPPAPVVSSARPDNLLFLGGDNLSKGARDVLAVWPRLLASGFNGELIWLGAIDQKFADLIAELPFANRIRLLGRVSREEVFAAAARCRAVLVTTRAESFGMATVESMSMGCVPVAWDIDTGTREIIRAKENGVFVKLGDFDSLAREVIAVMLYYERLGAEAMRDSRERFSENVMWRRYAEMFEEIIARPAAARSCSGELPPPYRAPRRHFQNLPAPLRRAAHSLIGASPRVGYWLRHLRGW